MKYCLLCLSTHTNLVEKESVIIKIAKSPTLFTTPGLLIGLAVPLVIIY